MAEQILIYISVIIAISAVLTLIGKLVRQPPIIAYLLAGILVGPLFLNYIGPASTSSELIQTFAHIGVAFLLFIVGLSLDFKVLKEVGKVSAFAGLAEIIITGGIGGLIALGLGFSNMSAIYIGAALAFSSTVVVVKILSDKKEIDTLHGRIALGILIVEDFVAAIALMIVPLINKGASIMYVFEKMGIIIGLTILIFLTSILLRKKVIDYLARNQEVLFLFGIAWALLLASLFDTLGFSLEIGALIAGMSLASSKYTLDLGGKIKPLRDFFMVLFFVFFGSQLSSTITSSILEKAIILSVFIVIGKPIIVMTILRIFGYKKRTNFLTGSSLAQISEFSLILMLLGFSLGHLNQELMSLGVLVAIITIGISSYSIYYANEIFSRISHLLNFFEGNKHRDVLIEREYKKYDIILIGYHRIGSKILQSLKKMKTNFVVIDYNPKTILSLRKEGIDCIYGDAADSYFLNEVPFFNAKLVISTIPDEYSNIKIKEAIKETNSKATFIATAEQPRQAIDLYEQGVDYVIIPQYLGGSLIATMVEAFKSNDQKFKEAGTAHYKELKNDKDNSALSQ